MIALMYSSGVPLQKTFATDSYVGKYLGFDGILKSLSFKVSSGFFLLSFGRVKGIAGLNHTVTISIGSFLTFCGVWFHLVESLLGYSTMINFEATYLNDGVPVGNKQNRLESS
jgi:hypothetical protein